MIESEDLNRIIEEVGNTPVQIHLKNGKVFIGKMQRSMNGKGKILYLKKKTGNMYIVVSEIATIDNSIPHKDQKTKN